MTHALVQEADRISSVISKRNLSSFGYRERIQIERLLFISLKLLTARYKFDLHGFTNEHIEKWLDFAANKDIPVGVMRTTEDIFQLKIFLKTICSSNAYVRNDAILRLGPNLGHVMPLIGKKLINALTTTARYLDNTTGCSNNH